MANFPEASPAILTDIGLTPADVKVITEQGEKGLIIRTTFQPTESTCWVSVYVVESNGVIGQEVARRVIFTKEVTE